MARPVRAFVVAALVAGTVWFVWQRLVPNDAAEIRSVLDRIAEGVGDDGGGGDVNRLARAAALRNELDPEITVDAGEPFQRLRGREMVIGAAARVRGSLRGLKVRFSDVEIEVEPDRQRAHVTLTAEAHFGTATGAPGFDARELAFVLRRLDDRWVIAEVSRILALKPINRR